MHKKAIIVTSIILALLLIGGAVLLARSRTAGPQVASPQPQRTVSQAELKRSDGKDGRPCLVAVDDTVYRIDGFEQWKDGQHTTSKGEAYCGADMTAVIGKSPHGRKYLDVLIKVGPLAKQ